MDGQKYHPTEIINSVKNISFGGNGGVLIDGNQLHHVREFSYDVTKGHFVDFECLVRNESGSGFLITNNCADLKKVKVCLERD